jgi:aspartokinase
MQTITNHLREHVRNDLVIYEAMQRGVLNLRAYARTIRKDIEAQRLEKVDVATLAVGLSRIEKEIQLTDPLSPPIKIRDLTTQSPLCEVTYLKDAVVASQLEQLSSQLRKDSKDFVVVTQGFREVTIVAPSRYKQSILDYIEATSTYQKDDLCAATVHFAESYLDVPNFIYVVLARLAVHKVNIIEIVSTTTELSLIIQKDDMETVNNSLQKLL